MVRNRAGYKSELVCVWTRRCRCNPLTLPTVMTKEVQKETVETRRMFAISSDDDSTAEAQKLPPFIATIT